MSIIKSEEDIQKLKHSALILASCLHHVLERANPGVSCGDLDNFAEEFIRSYEARPAFKGQYGYPHSLISEINEEVVHGLSPKEKIIPEKCVISFDCGVEYQGLYSDMCVLTHFGDVGEEVLNMITKTEESLWAGIAQVKAGKKVGDIGWAVDNVLKPEGLGNVTALGGHGLGYSVHDAPHITHKGKKGQGVRLMQNQVIAIEPMVTLGSGEVDFVLDDKYNWEVVYSKERVWSAHIEHSILVTRNGHIVLTDIPDSEILPIK